MIKNKVGIIGLGYVGLPLSLAFARAKFDVYGFDIDKKKIKILNNKKSYIKHIANNTIAKYINKSLFVSNDFEDIAKVKLIILCLPTPLKKNKVPDLSFIKITLKNILNFLKPGQIISLESSTYPGTTDEIIVEPLMKKFDVGKNFFVIYSPERENPGDKVSIESIPKVISGFSKKCLSKGIKLYSEVFNNLIPVKNLKTAEMTKLLENIYRSVNIGLINEMKIISKKFGLDIYEVINAAKSKPFGFKAFYPGPGVGGHCIPVDPFYLTKKKKKMGVDTKFIRLAGNINETMPDWITKKVIKLIPKKNNNKILIIGVAYKKNVDDYRESPILKIMKLLEKRKYNIDYHDPFIPKLTKTRKYVLNKKSIILKINNIIKYDCIIIGTDHDKVDYKKLKKYSKLIIDLRGKFIEDKKEKIFCL